MRVLHERTGAASTLGIDSSRAMLAQSAQHAGDGLTFEFDDIAEWAASQPVDVVFSNAALHWIEDHGGSADETHRRAGASGPARRPSASQPRPSIAPRRRARRR